MKMLIDSETLKRHIASDPDLPCEAGYELAPASAYERQARADGAAEERACIVAWLRRRANAAAQHGWAGDPQADWLSAAATAIERNEHAL